MDPRVKSAGLRLVGFIETRSGINMLTLAAVTVCQASALRLNEAGWWWAALLRIKIVWCGWYNR